MKGKLTVFVAVLAFTLAAATGHAQVKILFDATKAEMAGNADWVIDADLANLRVNSSGAYVSSSGTKSNPQRIPTPAQSGITATTIDTYWKGALSGWAVDCVNAGYTVETLPWDVAITYGNTANPQDLSNYKVYVIDEPNKRFADAEKTAILQFVQNGGGLFIISDHDNSDRDGDGWDSPAVWNDLLANNSVMTNPFGFTFDLDNISGASTNVVASATDSLIHGPAGNVGFVQWANGTTMTLNTASNPTVKGVVYATGAGGTNTQAMVAYARYGAGKVAAMGDSSPADDGSGNPDCVLYNGYYTDAGGNHRRLIMNMTIWLAGRVPVSIEEVSNTTFSTTVYPNPSTCVIYISTDVQLTNTSINIYNFAGQLVAQQHIDDWTPANKVSFSLLPGAYVAQVHNGKALQTSRFTVY